MRYAAMFLAYSTAAFAQGVPVSPAEKARACDEDALFSKLEPLKVRFELFRDAQVNSRELGRSLRVLTEELRSLDKAYAPIAAACGEPSVRARFMVGRLYDEYAQKLTAMPTPPGLDPEQEKIFRRELENKVAPMRERSKQAFADCVRRADELGLDGEIVQAARAHARAP